MRSLAILIGAVALVALVIAAAWLVLPACGLRLPLGLGDWQFCPAAMAASDQGADLASERAALLRQITEAQTRLAALQCRPAAVPPITKPDAPLGRRAVEGGDVGALEGCWALSSDYSTVDPKGGARVDYPAWQVCFDAAGKGRETMRGSDGTSCEGPVQVGFDQAGTMVIAEPGDLPCSNGYSIYRRQVRCTVDAAGLAQCHSIQPEVDGDLGVTLQRAKEQP